MVARLALWLRATPLRCLAAFQERCDASAFESCARFLSPSVVNMSAVLDIAPSTAYMWLMARTLGNRLKVARAERNLSQDQLARLAGVTRQTISSIETGLYCPSALLAFTLAERIGKPVDELFFLEGEPDDLPRRSR
jgi:putative transcriptional regulator